MKPEISFEKLYSPNQEERVERAETFEELVEVALEILDQMPHPVGIVCGPITNGGFGSVEANIAEFKDRIKQLKAEGMIIFDQMPFEPHMWRIKETPYYDARRDHLLEDFYGRLFENEHLATFYFIPGWEGSYGARWEHERARQLEKEIVYLK